MNFEFHPDVFDFVILGTKQEEKLNPLIFIEITKMPQGLKAYIKNFSGEDYYCFDFISFILCFGCGDFEENCFYPDKDFILVEEPNTIYPIDSPVICFNQEFLAVIGINLFEKLYAYRNETMREFRKRMQKLNEDKWLQQWNNDFKFFDYSKENYEKKEYKWI